eukprot:scaffold137590_cov34-Prasinocladus_malaysianus.AAC.1
MTHGLIQEPPVPAAICLLQALSLLLLYSLPTNCFIRAHQSSCFTCMRSITRHDQSLPPKIPINISPEVFHILTPGVDCFALPRRSAVRTYRRAGLLVDAISLASSRLMSCDPLLMELHALQAAALEVITSRIIF